MHAMVCNYFCFQFWGKLFVCLREIIYLLKATLLISKQSQFEYTEKQACFGILIQAKYNLSLL